MKRLLLLLALVLLSISACSKERASDPSDEDLKDEFQLKGSISGTVTDSSGKKLSGVAVTVEPGGYATNTDTLGRYTIPDMPADTYTVYFFKTNYADTIVEDVILSVDQDKRSVNMKMRFEMDSLTGEIIDSALRTVQAVGGLTDSADVASVGLVVKNSEGDTVPLANATWNRTSGRYSLKLRVPKEGGSIEVKVRDGEGHIMGYHVESFDADTNQIQLATFAATNAQGKAKVVFSPANATINDSIDAQLTLTDTFGGKVVRWWYKWNNAGKYTEGNSTNISLKTPELPMTSVPFMVKVLDDDSNLVEYELPFGKVVDDVPSLKLEPSDTNIAQGTTLKLSAVASDKGSLTLNWKMDGGSWTKGSKDYSKAFAANHEGFHTIYVKASDEDGNFITDSVFVFVGPLFTDSRDKQRYRYTMVNGVPWMAENLRYGGDEYYTWAEAVGLADSCNIKDCGDQVSDGRQGVCPTGWHVASNTDWDHLANLAGGLDIAGEKLKSRYAWGNNGGTDKYLLNFKPMGHYDEKGALYFQGTNAYYWQTADTSDLGKENFSYKLETASDRLQEKDGVQKLYSLTVRCVGSLEPIAKIDYSTAPEFTKAGDPLNLKVAQVSGTAISPDFVVHWKIGNGTWLPANPVDFGVVAQVPTGLNWVSVVLRVTAGSDVAYDTTWMDANFFEDTRDGKRYHITYIGGKSWFASNLDYHGDNEDIGLCYYDGTYTYCNWYGRLYSWEEAMNGESASDQDPSGVQGICPDGSHLPSFAEWKSLFDAITGGTSGVGVAPYLKDSDSWGGEFNRETDNTNDYGFSMLAGGGYRDDSQEAHQFHAALWTSTTSGQNAQSIQFSLNSQDAFVIAEDYSLQTYFSVRCVVDP